ncbi:hypothetical protein D3C81_2024920 [compost metagenome]
MSLAVFEGNAPQSVDQHRGVISPPVSKLAKAKSDGCIAIACRLLNESDGLATGRQPNGANLILGGKT